MLPTHVLHVGQPVKFQDSASKCCYPAVIYSLCPGPRSYKITSGEGIVYRKTQSCLKPYTPKNKNLQSNKYVSQLMVQSNHMWPVKTEHKKSQVNNQMQVQTSRLKRDTKPQSSLIYKYFKCLLSEYLDI